MAEDTDLTYRLFVRGYDVRYLNSAACYEEVPESWPPRYRQVRRWAYGHNQCLFEHFVATLRAPGRSLRSRLDAALVLLFYLYPAVMLVAFGAAIMAPTLSGVSPLWLLLPLVFLFCGFGNLAPFFQVAVAAWKDRQPEALAVLPLLPVSSALTMLAATHGFGSFVADRLRRRAATWDKTQRFRHASATDAVAQPPAPDSARNLARRGRREEECHKHAA